jgi:hypothetical protein
MQVTIRIGKKITPERFAAVKVYIHKVRCLPEHRFDISRVPVKHQKVTTFGEMARQIIDMGTVQEGQAVELPEDAVTEGLRSRDEMADLLKDALKGTGLEGLDEKP